MKTILLGNAGAGKSSLARQLLTQEPAACLSLDDVAFQTGTAERRPLADSIAAARHFIAEHDSWIIEGCYADIIEALLPDCDELIFLNPGVASCVAHCRARPWEPDKFSSPAAQDAGLEFLLEWVRSYTTRDDEYGFARHRALFDGFAGSKREYTDAKAYGAES